METETHHGDRKEEAQTTCRLARFEQGGRALGSLPGLLLGD